MNFHTAWRSHLFYMCFEQIPTSSMIGFRWKIVAPGLRRVGVKYRNQLDCVEHDRYGLFKTRWKSSDLRSSYAWMCYNIFHMENNRFKKREKKSKNAITATVSKTIRWPFTAVVINLLSNFCQRFSSEYPTMTQSALSSVCHATSPFVLVAHKTALHRSAPMRRA